MAIAAAGLHTCALDADGTVRCWGANFGGVLGLPADDTPHATPALVAGVAGATDLFVGLDQSCARVPSGITCWGRAGGAATVAIMKDATQIASGLGHVCILDKAGAVRCWGENGYGQLGLGDGQGPQDAPVVVPALTKVAQIAAAGFVTCARLAVGVPFCWGFNQYGHLGDGTKVDKASPVAVKGLSDVALLAVGDQHSCAGRSDGSTWCWGFNNSGQVGPGTQSYQAFEPLVVPGKGWVSGLGLGELHTCRLVDTGAVDCWGSNTSGELGRGTMAPDDYGGPNPAPVVGLADATRIVAGAYHTCALRTDHSVVCWGYNTDGELGDGTTETRCSPTPVLW